MVESDGVEVAGEHVVASRRDVKRRRFVRIGTKRTQQVLVRLRLLGKCANRGIYEYTPEEVEKIFNAIREELDDVQRKFRDRDRKRPEFSL